MDFDLGQILDVGLLGVVFLLVVVGKFLRLEREVNDRDARIKALEAEGDRRVAEVAAGRDARYVEFRAEIAELKAINASYQHKFEDEIFPVVAEALKLVPVVRRRSSGGDRA